MLRFFLYGFLNVFKESEENITHEKLIKYISNENLIEDIIFKKKLQSMWRSKLENKITNNHYSLKSLEVKKSANYAMLVTKLYHSFSLINSTIKKSCKEEIQCIFILKDMKILHMFIKEEFPLEYNNLLQNFSNKEFHLNSIKHPTEKHKYNKFIENIDSLYHDFNQITSKISRGYYNKSEYNLDKAKMIEYARKYALKYNKSYKNFDNSGGDCTNFVSQCLHEGGLPYSLTWKPYTNTWIRVNELYYYTLKLGFNSTDNLSYMSQSDIIQFHSTKKGFFSHSGIISEVLPNNDCLYCCHSFDKLDYPLSEVYPLFYGKVRIINI